MRVCGTVYCPAYQSMAVYVEPCGPSPYPLVRVERTECDVSYLKVYARKERTEARCIRRKGLLGHIRVDMG